MLKVNSLAEKFATAISILKPGSLFVFPGGNEDELTANMRQLATVRGIVLVPVFRVENALERIGLSISRTWLECPFRGLEPFEFEHSSIFFGRDRDIDDLLALLAQRVAKGQNAVLIQGSSGSGKSSLALAGLMPALLRRGLPDGRPRNIRWGLLRPRHVKSDIDTGRERQSLADAVLASWHHGKEGGLSAHGENPPDALNSTQFFRWLEAQNVGQGAQFIWILDQMEEWFRSPLQPATVRVLCTFLAEISRRGVWLVATLTSTAHSLLNEHSELAARFGVEGQYRLGPPQQSSSLDAVIRGPAQAAGLRFESDLDTEIFAAASRGGADVLPLLELLLMELYERRDPSCNELRFADYQAVGGLDGVISARAEAVYEQCTEQQQAAVPALLWKLATSGEIVPSEYEANSSVPGLLEAFREKRLLVEDRNAGGTSSLRAAHEALFRHWPRAIEQRGQDDGDIRLWLDLTREAGQWVRRERALIPPGPQLRAADALCRRRAGHWTASDAATVHYVQTSLRQRDRRRVLMGAALAIPAIAAGGFGLRALAGYVEGLHLTRIRFDAIAVPPPDYLIAAAPYLRRFGVSLLSSFPATARLVIISNTGLYGGQAVESDESQHFLTIMSDPPAAPIGYTLGFDHPVSAVKLLRPVLWAATASGVSHPAWTAYALDKSDAVIAQTHEGISARYHLHEKVPASWHVLQPTQGKLIAGLRIIADDRKDGVFYAGTQSALFEEIQLVH